MADAHQALSYSISADDRASAVFRGVSQELRNMQGLAQHPLQGLNREWESMGKRAPLQMIKAEQAVQIARTEQEIGRLNKTMNASGVATKLQAAELDLLTRRHASAQKAIDATAASHAHLAKAGTVAAVGIVATTAAVISGAVKQNLAWNDLAKNIEQQTGLSGKSLDGLMGTINNVSGTVPYKLQEIADAAVILRTRFHQTDPQIEKSAGLMDAFAKRAGSEVTPAIQGLSNILHSYREPLSDVVGLTDELVSVSQLTQQPLGTMESTIERFSPKLQAMGFGLKESIKLMGILGESGVRADQMGRGLATAYGAAQKALGGAAGPQAALLKLTDATTKAREKQQVLEATAPKTAAEQVRHTAEVKRASEATAEAVKKEEAFKKVLNEAGGAHASVANMVKAEIGQIEHAKSSSEAFSLGVAAFGKQVGPSFARAFYNNKAAIEATDHALHKHGSTQKLVSAEQKEFQGQVTELREEWHKTERTLGKDLIPALKTFLGLVKGGVEDIDKFTKGNASLAEALGGVATLGAVAFLGRKPIGALAKGTASVFSKVTGIGGPSGTGVGDISGVRGTTMPGSLTNPIMVRVEGGGGAGTPGAPSAPKGPVEDPRLPTRSGVKGLGDKVLNSILNPTEHPVRTAGILAAGISGFAAAGAPGVKQTPGSIAKEFLHGADPSAFVASVANKIFGTHVPSVTGALGITGDKLGFDPLAEPQEAVRYILTGQKPAGKTAPTTAPERHFGTVPSPGRPQATRAGEAPEHPGGLTRPARTTDNTKAQAEAAQDLTQANARLQAAQEQVNSVVEIGRKGTPEYKKAVKQLAEAEVERRKALESLERAQAKGAYLTPSQKQQLADLRSGLNINKQAQSFSASRGVIEGDIRKLDAEMRAHPSKATAAAVNANYNVIIEGIGAEMAAGLKSVQQGNKEIDSALLAEAKVLGLNPSQVSSIIGKTAGAAGGLVERAVGALPSLGGGAKGMRVPGAVGPDNWTLVDPSGRPAAKVGGAEILIANRHTEARVDSMLAPYGTTLGAQVAGEHTPHTLAKGGRIRGPVSTFGPPGEAAGGTAYGSSSSAPGIAVNPHGGSNWNDALARSFAGLVGRVTVAGHSANLKVIDKGPSAIGSKGPRLIDITGAGVAAMGLDPRTFPTDAIGEADFGGALIAAVGGAASQALHAMKLKVPHWKGPGGLVGAVGRAALAKATHAANARLVELAPSGTPPGGGGGTVTGPARSGGGFDPSQLGSFDGLQVARWIIPELQYARAHGWSGPVTSGYRAGFDPHAPSGSMHALDIYPGGAVDFGGMVDPAGLANRAAFIRATAGYGGKRLLTPIGFRDDGHMSGTGHALGGRVDYAGAFSGGGSVTADKPTLALFGEGGRETATFTPHAALGTRVGGSGLAETPGNNPDTGAIEYHTSEEWAELHRQHTAKTKREHHGHRGPKPTYEDLVRVGGMAAGTVTLTSSSGIDVPGDVSKLSAATWKKVVAAVEKTIKGTSDARVAVGLAGELSSAHPHDKKTADRLRDLTTKGITDAASTVVRLTKATPQGEALSAGTTAISRIDKLAKDARKSHNGALVAGLTKDAEWAFKWASSTIQRTAAEAPPGQAAGAAGKAVSQLSKLMVKASAEGRRTIQVGLLKDMSKEIASWHSAITSTLTKRQDVAKAGSDLRVAQQTLNEMRSGGAGVKIKAGSARDATFIKAEETANNKAVAEMRKEQAAISAMIGREQGLLHKLTAKLHRELKHHHKAAAKAIQAEINQIQAALGEAQTQMEEVTASIQQAETANLNLAAEQMKAAYEAFKEEIDEATRGFESGREAIGTRGTLEEGELHRAGKDFGALSELKSEQEGSLTPTQIAQAQADLAAATKRRQEEIASEASQRAYDESKLSGLSGEDRANMEKAIRDLTLGINDLQNQVYDSTKETKKLTEATNAAAKVFGGTVGFDFNGQQYVPGGSNSMSSASPSDIMTGT